MIYDAAPAVLAERDENQRELICRDFDLDCFDVGSPCQCAIGGEIMIKGSYYYCSPIKGICPMIKY